MVSTNFFFYMFRLNDLLLKTLQFCVKVVRWLKKPNPQDVMQMQLK